MRQRLTVAVGVAAIAGVAACGRSAPTAGSSSSPAPQAASPQPTTPASAAPSASVAPAARSRDPNPLGLPPRRLKLDAGKRVFTFPEAMLAEAKPGSTLVLYAASVTGFDGDDLLVEGKGGPPYRVHAGYVIPVPDDPKLKPGDPVLAEHAGVMKHGVFLKQLKDRLVVRYTDLDSRAPEASMKGGRIVKQVDGLVPGNYAALRQDAELRHVLLVSPADDGDHKRWFCLGFGGAAMIVDEAALQPIPVKLHAKAGDVVLAEWVGTLRKATVQATVDPAFFTVKYDRAGRPATLGWGHLLKVPGL
jgi:hypothetical protein